MNRFLLVCALLGGSVATVAAQQLECSVISAAGGVSSQGDLVVFGQAIDGNFSNGSATLDAGVIPCWTSGAGCVGDVNANGQIELSDLAALLAAFGSCPGDPEYVAEADLTGDTCVTLSDLAEMLVLFGETCP